MTEEKELQLIRKYPKIFRDCSSTKEMTSMVWGLECGDGWYDLIDYLCSNLQLDIDQNGHPQVVAVQVKEKFGQLRFYILEGDERQYAVIDFAEQLSLLFCERCGTNRNVTLHGDGWWRTLCSQCKEGNHKS